MEFARNESRVSVATLNAAMKGVTFGKIENRAERVLILGAGPSLQRVDRALLQRVCSRVRTIAVNAACAAIARPSDWFTLDFDVRTRGFAARCRPPTRVIAAVPTDFATPQARLQIHRCVAPTGVLYLQRLEGTGPLKSRYGLSTDPAAINTGNSVWGALGVAWHMRPLRIGFLGLDGTDKPGWPGAHPPRSLDHLHDLFESALPQLTAQGIDVINGNPQSNIRCFDRVSAVELLHWIGED